MNFNSFPLIYCIFQGQKLNHVYHPLCYSHDSFIYYVMLSNILHPLDSFLNTFIVPYLHTAFADGSFLALAFCASVCVFCSMDFPSGVAERIFIFCVQLVFVSLFSLFFIYDYDWGRLNVFQHPEWFVYFFAILFLSIFYLLIILSLALILQRVLFSFFIFLSPFLYPFYFFLHSFFPSFSRFYFQLLSSFVHRFLSSFLFLWPPFYAQRQSFPSRLSQSIASGDLSSFQKLSSSPYFFHFYTPTIHLELWEKSCRDGSLSWVTFLLTFQRFNHSFFSQCRFHSYFLDLEQGFHLSCQHGHVDLVLYFLQQSQPSQQAPQSLLKSLGYRFSSSHFSISHAFSLACIYGQLPLARSLLHPSFLSSFTPLSVEEQYQGLLLASTQPHLSLISWLILDHGLPPSSSTDLHHPKLGFYFQLQQEQKILQSLMNSPCSSDSHEPALIPFKSKKPKKL